MSDAAVYSPPDPAALVPHLRRAGFKLGSGEVLRCVALLECLRARGQAPKSREETARWLAPVLCTNPLQQAALPSLMASFEALGSPLPPPPAPVPAPAPPAPVDRPAQRGGWAPRLRSWLPWLVLAAVAIGALIAVRLWPAVATDVSPEPVPQPLATSPVFRPIAGIALPPAVLGALVAGLAPWLAWGCIRFWQRGRRAVLTHAPYDGRAATDLYPTGRGLRLYDLESESALADRYPSDRGRMARGRDLGQRIRHAVDGWRVRRWVRDRRIDVPSSARASAEAGGVPRIVRRLRGRQPEYPMLIETQSGRDHLLVLGRALGERLRSGGIAHVRYLFGADPRVVRADQREATAESLESLGNRYGHQVLVIVSNGEFIDDLGRGGRHDGVGTLFTAWQLAVLLTPVPQHRWSWRERRLAAAGLVLLPLTPEGFVALGELLRKGGSVGATAVRRPARQDVLSAGTAGALVWQSQQVPDRDGREEILDAIAARLPPVALEHLCVLALFPQLRPDLTLYMALQMGRTSGGPALEEAEYAALCALPWMRIGYLPDWLRLDLAKSLSPATAQRARIAYAQWLERLERGTGPAAEVSSPALLITSAEHRVRKTIEDDPGSELSDALFLRFLSGTEPDALDQEVGQEVVDKVIEDAARRRRRGLLLATLATGVVMAGQFVLPEPLDRIKFNDMSMPLIILSLALTPIVLWQAARGQVPDRPHWISLVAVGVAVVFLGTSISAHAEPWSTERPFVAALMVAPHIAFALGRPRPSTSMAGMGSSNCIALGLALLAIGVPLLAKQAEPDSWTFLLGALGLGLIQAGYFGVGWILMSMYVLGASLFGLMLVGITADIPLLESLLPLQTKIQTRVVGWIFVVPLAIQAWVVVAVAMQRRTNHRALLLGCLGAILLGWGLIIAVPAAARPVARYLPPVVVMAVMHALGPALSRRQIELRIFLPATGVLLAIAAAADAAGASIDLGLMVTALALPLVATIADAYRDRALSIAAWRAAVWPYWPTSSLWYLLAMWTSTMVTFQVDAPYPVPRATLALAFALPLTIRLALTPGTSDWRLVVLAIVPLCNPSSQAEGFGTALACLGAYAVARTQLGQEFVRTLNSRGTAWLIAVLLPLAAGWTTVAKPYSLSLGFVDGALWLMVLCGFARVRGLTLLAAIATIDIAAVITWSRPPSVDPHLLIQAVMPVTAMLAWGAGTLFRTFGTQARVLTAPSLGVSLAVGLGVAVAGTLEPGVARSLLPVRFEDLGNFREAGFSALNCYVLGAATWGLLLYRYARDRLTVQRVVVVVNRLAAIQVGAAIVFAFLVIGDVLPKPTLLANDPLAGFAALACMPALWAGYIVARALDRNRSLSIGLPGMPAPSEGRPTLGHWRVVGPLFVLAVGLALRGQPPTMPLDLAIAACGAWLAWGLLAFVPSKHLGRRARMLAAAAALPACLALVSLASPTQDERRVLRAAPMPMPSAAPVASAPSAASDPARSAADAAATAASAAAKAAADAAMQAASHAASPPPPKSARKVVRKPEDKSPYDRK